LGKYVDLEACRGISDWGTSIVGGLLMMKGMCGRSIKDLMRMKFHMI